MADEISLLINAQIANQAFRDQFRPGTRRYDQSAWGSAAGTIELSSNSTTANFGDVVGAQGWCFLTNLSTALDALVGPTSDAMFLRLPPESSHAFHLSSDSTMHCMTTASTGKLWFKCWRV